jgi:hypothetical protein
MKPARICGAAFVALLAIAAADTARAGVVFTDTTFNPADYISSPVYTSDVSASIVPAFSPGQLQFTSTFTAPGNPPTYTVAEAEINSTFSYSPASQGAISSIDASVFKNIATSFSASGFGNTFRPTTEQDGIFYLAAIPGLTFTGPNEPGGTGFLSFSQSGLTASDFLSFDFATGTFGTGNPNFDGDPLTFGLTQLTDIAIDQTGNLITQFQNLSFDIHGIPEPGSLTLLGAALVSFGFGARRKSSRAAAKPE